MEPHQRQEQHQRGRRRSCALRARCATATSAQRDRQWRRRASALPAITLSMPTTANRSGSGAGAEQAAKLPVHKVDDFIAKIHYSTPGVRLIYPRPASRRSGSRSRAAYPQSEESVDRARIQREALHRGSWCWHDRSRITKAKANIVADQWLRRRQERLPLQ